MILATSWLREAPLRSTVLATALLVAAGFTLTALRSTAETVHTIPAPAVDEQLAPGAAASEVAVLAGGCFWGVQGVFQHVSGVTSAVSGYAGGDENTAHYDMVGTGGTGHAESVQIAFDPNKISYGRILQIYFSVAHDPTQLNRQGPDVGAQYRSAIFPANPEQARIAKAYIAQLNEARAFEAAIITKIEPDRTFYAAEDYHQDFMTKHPFHPYIVYNDLPKIDDLKRVFPETYRAEPVLVVAEPWQTGATYPARDKHPGQIVFEDLVEKRTWTDSAAEVPPTIAWVKVAGHWKPVVQIEINGVGDQREITKFGPNHEFLEVTTARMGPPAGR
jgi:peptide-methionine (S)-S-oxide reductase